MFHLCKRESYDKKKKELIRTYNPTMNPVISGSRSIGAPIGYSCDTRGIISILTINNE